jgi:hypothetical protein
MQDVSIMFECEDQGATIAPDTRPVETRKLPLRVLTILNCVSADTGIPVELVRGRDRGRNTTRTRHIVWHLVREMLPALSIASIGRMFGRDHTSVLSGLRKMQSEIAINPSFAAYVTGLEQTSREAINTGRKISTPTQPPSIIKPAPKELPMRSGAGYIDERGQIICYPY